MPKSLIYIALGLVLCGTGCKRDAVEYAVAETPQVIATASATPTPPVVAGSAQNSADQNQNVAAELSSVTGVLQYENLEGGLWRLVTEQQSWVLRSAVGQPAIEVMLRQQTLRAGQRVIVQGKPASAEGNIGIHMAGPYYEVTSIKSAD